ncbi:glycosyltransferase family 2 protein [Flavobacterium sp. D11R37]|uniref:glycosyltransferase family 2 protein n=1 Tax=Flavobacterium coralii TaxID=2838017 RepID=UPI001CA73D12|nr:galactosyltransferase-related protein [Flavobacterium coralii]MBY8961787.1 glycosyltransferase family 2 protein [Flavobacterium coralii]
MKLDVIMPVMNKPSLEKVLTHFYTLENYINNLIVVDFNPQQNFHLDKLCSLNQIYVAIRSQKYFNKSLANNIGFSKSSSEYITFCDADVLIEPDYFLQIKEMLNEGCKNAVFILDHVIETFDGTKRPAPGICSCPRNAFIEIEGYSSEFEGWGKEDQDFLHRLRLNQMQEYRISFGHHISHSNEERIKNYNGDNISAMRNKNNILFKNRVDNNVLRGTYVNDLQKIKYDDEF